MSDFRWDTHAKMFQRCLLGAGLPSQYTTAASQRVTLAYFCITGLDLLNKLSILSAADKARVESWIFSRKILPDGVFWRHRTIRKAPPGGLSSNPDQGRVAVRRKPRESGLPTTEFGDGTSEGSLAMIYSALAALVALGVELGDLDAESIARALGSLQQGDGRCRRAVSMGGIGLCKHLLRTHRMCFRASPSDSTCDLRFMYCACAVSTFVGDWSGVDRPKAAAYIERCYDFDGGIGLAPGRESCAGPTYCAVASLELMGLLDTLATTRRHRLLEWCVNRQGDGFQGRPNKPTDSCCSYWVGGALALLNGVHFVDRNRARTFHLSCQNKILGGFAKVPGTTPDLLHSFYSVCWLSLSEEGEVQAMDAALGITERAAARLKGRRCAWGTHQGTTNVTS